MATRRLQNRPRPNLEAEQKIALALLIFLGAGGIIFGFRSFGSHLYRPIQEQFAKYYTGADVVNENAAEDKEREAQKKRDADVDGLSDYDELYVYKTSPYLKDSDSDTIDDKTEVFGGTDPNCPKGKDCEVVGEKANTTDLSPEGILGSESAAQAGAMNPLNSTDPTTFVQSATIQNIRAALLKAGMKQSDLDKVSDEDLKKLLDQTMSDANKNGQLNSLIGNQ